MSHDAIQNSEYRPLTPLNTIHGRSNNGLKAHKQLKVKETKPAMEICDVKINAAMDLELAGRLTSTAIEQFLFFMNQVPFPVSRLAKVPANNDKAARLRGDFMTSHTRLSNDIKSALGFAPEVADGCTPLPIRIVITLGSIMMPKSTMLFQLPVMQGGHAHAASSVAAAALMSHSSSSSASIDLEKELPPDSDSDHDETSSDEESDVLKFPTTPQPSNKIAPSTSPARSSFTPFCDVDATPSPQLTLPASTSNPRLSSRPTFLTRSPASPGTLNVHPSNSHPISDENQRSKARLEKRFKVAERELTVALSNLDIFTEETELSKIHVYLQAPRSYKGTGWLPRVSAAKTLDSLVRFPNVDASARTKLAKMNACAIRVALTNGEHEASGSPHDMNNVEEYIWLEWDGKLTGVE